jgi:hypothetical protein
MRALTLWRPWPWAIANGYKRVENRDWAPPEWLLGQRMAIHAGKKYDKASEVEICKLLGRDSLPAEARVESAIVAVVTVAGVCNLDRQHLADFPGWKDQTAWSFGPYVWLLKDVVAIEPVPCRGAQGLWNLPTMINDIVVRRVHTETEESR